MSKSSFAMRDFVGGTVDVVIGVGGPSMSLRVGIEERIVAVFVQVERVRRGCGRGNGGDSGEKREVSVGYSSGGTYIERCSLNFEPNSRECDVDDEGVCAI